MTMGTKIGEQGDNTRSAPRRSNRIRLEPENPDEVQSAADTTSRPTDGLTQLAASQSTTPSDDSSREAAHLPSTQGLKRKFTAVEEFVGKHLSQTSTWSTTT